MQERGVRGLQGSEFIECGEAGLRIVDGGGGGGRHLVIALQETPSGDLTPAGLNGRSAQKTFSRLVLCPLWWACRSSSWATATWARPAWSRLSRFVFFRHLTERLLTRDALVENGVAALSAQYLSQRIHTELRGGGSPGKPR